MLQIIWFSGPKPPEALHAVDHIISMIVTTIKLIKLGFKLSSLKLLNQPLTKRATEIPNLTEMAIPGALQANVPQSQSEHVQ
jgi:hypothetical protein